MTKKLMKEEVLHPKCEMVVIDCIARKELDNNFNTKLDEYMTLREMDFPTYNSEISFIPLETEDEEIIVYITKHNNNN